MEKFKVFISQPMRGKTNEEIIAERNNIEGHARAHCPADKELEILDSFKPNEFENEHSVKNVPLYYLAKSLEYLAEADLAIFGTGWKNARGCQIEHKCAEAYGVEFINL